MPLVRITHELHGDLETIASANGRTVSEVTNEALSLWFDMQGCIALREATKVKKGKPVVELRVHASV